LKVGIISKAFTIYPDYSLKVELQVHRVKYERDFPEPLFLQEHYEVTTEPAATQASSSIIIPGRIVA
jgi:hypothetical protein